MTGPVSRASRPEAGRRTTLDTGPAIGLWGSMNNTEVTMAYDTEKPHTLDAHRVALQAAAFLADFVADGPEGTLRATVSYQGAWRYSVAAIRDTGRSRKSPWAATWESLNAMWQSQPRTSRRRSTGHPVRADE